MSAAHALSIGAMEMVLLVQGPRDGEVIAWPLLGYQLAPHAFVALCRASTRDASHARAVYALDALLVARARRTATFLGLRGVYAVAASAETRSARTESSAG